MPSQTKNSINESLLVTARDRNTNDIQAVVSPNNFQVGLEKSPADTTLRGRFSINAKNYIVSKLNNWTVKIDEDTTLASIEISSADVDEAFSKNKSIIVYLPPKPRTGQVVTVKDFSGAAGKIGIKIYDPTFSKIDNDDYKNISTYYDSLQFYWQGTKWICSSAIGSRGLTKYYANLYDDSDQTLGSAGVAQILSIQHYSETYGITLTNNQITFDSIGTYNIIYSLQFQNKDNQPQAAYVWLKLNGTNIPFSTSRFDIPGKKSANVFSYVVGTVPFITSVNQGDYIEIYWTADDTNVSIETFPLSVSPSYPVNPGVIVTVQQI